MAVLRLLTLSLLLLANGCTFGPIWAPTLEGTIRSEETGEPIAGVIVVSFYHIRNYSLGGRCTQTDADGHFIVPGHTAVYPLWFTGRSIEGPQLLAFHRQLATAAWHESRGYRLTGEWLDRTDLRLRMKRSAEPSEVRWESECSYFVESAGDMREDFRMDGTCEAIFDEVCPGVVP